MAFEPVMFVADNWLVPGHLMEPNVNNDWGRLEKQTIHGRIQDFFSKFDDDEEEITISAWVGLAKTVGVYKPENLGHKVALVRAIQIAADHQPCYRTEQRTTCKNDGCIWQKDCKKLLAEWCR